MHQPVTMPIDETSGSKFIESGTLTDQMLSPRTGVVPNIDLFLPELGLNTPNWVQTYTITSASEWIFFVDPWVFLWKNRKLSPWPNTILKSHNFYDFDVEYTFYIVKHPAARGCITFRWCPGHIVLGDDIKPAPPDDTRSDRNQRFIWDIATTNTFSITLKGYKHESMRTFRLPTAVDTPTEAQVDNFSEVMPNYSSARGGTLFASITQPFRPSNIGPDFASILMYVRFVDPKFAEYVGPQYYSGLDTWV